MAKTKLRRVLKQRKTLEAKKARLHGPPGQVSDTVGKLYPLATTTQKIGEVIFDIAEKIEFEVGKS